MAVSFGGVDYTGGSAVDIVRSILAPYGLGALAERMYGVGKETGSADAAYIWLRDQPEYKKTFPGMEERKKNGLEPIDESTYMHYKSQMKATMQAHGIPAKFYDEDSDFADFIGKDISPQEIEARVVKGVVAARQAPQDVRDALFNFYGIDDGHLAAYWLDPSPERGEQLLKEQAATYVAAAAKRGNFGALSRQEAEGLTAYEQDPAQLEQRFSNLAQSQELMTGLSSEVLGTLSREDQLAYARGSEEAKREIEKRANMRKAAFAGGGGFAETQQGVAGLASQK